jgi:hypothetical protein
MQTHLRLDRRDPTGWTLADGPHTIGWIIPGRLTFTGFADPATAADAAATAARVLERWAAVRSRIPRDSDQIVRVAVNETGFVCDVPDHLWQAVQLELAQRIHAATLALRSPSLEPVA